MENTSYALYIVAGMLIAITIISIIVFNWRQIGGFEKSKEEIVDTENMAKFNAEFEAYDRGLMYGTDVLSCLNKAQNNNQRYVYNNYYGTDTENFGKDDRQEFFVDVSVKINSPLYEEIKAYYEDSKGKYQRAIGLGNDTNTKSNYGNKLISNDKNSITDPKVDYYYFKNGIVYQDEDNYSKIMWKGKGYDSWDLYKVIDKGGRLETCMEEGTYHLLTTEDSSNAKTDASVATDAYNNVAMLSALVSTVSLKTQKIVNKDRPTSLDKSDWSYYSWETAASDFKSRKFKCLGTEYSKITGYVERISFEEIEK